MFWKKKQTETAAVDSRWKQLTQDVSVYFGTDGKILGEVKTYTGSTWWAEVNSSSLGRYITPEAAKAAVEAKAT